MMNKLALILVSISFLFVGCTDYSMERKQVADLMDQVDAAESKLATLATSSLPMSEEDITGRLKLIGNHFTEKGETFDKELAIQLADFKVNGKVFKGMNEKQEKLKKEIILSRKQLKNLDQDLKNKSVDKAQLQKYLDDERMACATLSASIGKMDTLMQRASQGYLNKVHGIDSIITSLGLTY